MRFIFFLFVLLNIGLFAYGQGYLGTVPAEVGRSVNPPQPSQPEVITLGTPLSS